LYLAYLATSSHCVIDDAHYESRSVVNFFEHDPNLSFLALNVMKKYLIASMIFGSKVVSFFMLAIFSSIKYATGRQAVVVWSTHNETMYCITSISIISKWFVDFKFLTHDVFKARLDLAECNAHAVARIKAIASLGLMIVSAENPCLHRYIVATGSRLPWCDPFFDPSWPLFR